VARDLDRRDLVERVGRRVVERIAGCHSCTAGLRHAGSAQVANSA
jgi:hypothetical protein